MVCRERERGVGERERLKKGRDERTEKRSVKRTAESKDSVGWGEL